MSSSHQEYKELGECIDLIIDHRGKTPKKLNSDWMQEGIPTISAKNVNSGMLVALDEIRYVTTDVYRKWMKEDVKPGDCFLVSEGATLGECLYWDENYPVVLGQRIFCIRTNPKVLYSRYFYAYMNTPEFQSDIKGRSTGSSVSGLRQTEVLKLKVKILPLSQQIFIGDFLYLLNKKIKLNSELNQTLEQMAQAIFQSWFVDFEPVKAKIAAREDWLARQAAQSDAHDDVPQFSSPVCYAHEFADAAASAPATQADLETFMNRAAMCAISGKTDADLDAMPVADYQRLYHTASLFPDEMVESELGEIPKGWEVKEIGDLVETVGGATPSTKNEEFWSPEEFHWTSPKDLSGISSPILLTTERRISKEGLKKISSGLLPVGSLLMSSRAPIGYLAITDIPVAINQGYIAMTPGGQLPPLYMLMWCKQYMEDIKGMANGSTFMEISKKSFRTLKAIIPSEEVIDSYLNQVDSMFKAIVSNEKEIGNLTVLRDSLLPKLLSGELDISALTDLSDNAAEPGAAHV